MIRYPLHRRLSGPQGQSGRVRKNSFLPGFDPHTVQPVESSHINWAKPGRKFNNTASFFQLPSEQNDCQRWRKMTLNISHHKVGTTFDLICCSRSSSSMDNGWGYQPQGFSVNVRQKTMFYKKLICILYEMCLTACLLTLVLLTSNNISFVVRNILIVLTCKIVPCFVRSTLKRLALCLLLHYVNTR